MVLVKKKKYLTLDQAVKITVNVIHAAFIWTH